MSLEGRSVERLIAVLLAAFPSAFDLREFARTRLNRRLPELTDTHDNLRRQCFELVEDLEAKGLICRLLFALSRARPDRVDVDELFAAADFEALLGDRARPREVAALVDALPPEADAILSAAVPPDLLGVPLQAAREELVWHLGELPRPRAAVHRLLEFALRVELLLGLPTHPPIEQWIRSFTARRRVELQALNSLRRRCQEELGDRLHLLVVAHEEEPGLFSLRAWLRRENPVSGAVASERLDPPGGAVTLRELPAAVDGLLGVEPILGLLCARGTRLRVEVILPLHCLLPADADLPWAERKVAKKHDLVFRWRERVYWSVKVLPPETAPEGWRRKWDNVHGGTAAHLPGEVWVSPDAATEDVTDDLEHDARTALAAGATFAARRAHRNKLLTQALHRGVPVMVWLADDCANEASQRLLASLVANAPRAAHAEVMEQRRALDAATAKGSRAVNLLWDDPDRLPPDATPDDLAAPAPSNESHSE